MTWITSSSYTEYSATQELVKALTEFAASGVLYGYQASEGTLAELADPFRAEHLKTSDYIAAIAWSYDEYLHYLICHEF